MPQGNVELPGGILHGVSEENLNAIRRGLDAFNRREKTRWFAVCDPDAENIPPKNWPESAPLRGAEAIWNFFVGAQEMWDEGFYEWGEIIEAGPDKIVANQRRVVRGRTSGAEAMWSYWVVLTFRNHRLLRFEWFDERADALEAAGMSA